MELAQEPSLSGAYIRSLVKQLTTTTKPKETMKTKHHENQNLRKNIKVQPQHHKKQVRRRLHTSRPYQENLLNMAEARREIVTALKFHRASMKQASEPVQQQKYQNQHHQQQESLLLVSHSSQHVSNFDFEQELRFKSRRNPRIYPSCTNNYSNDFSYSSYFSHPSLSFPNTHTWPNSSSFSPTLLVENSNFTLPNQTLGLNLSLHDFNNLDATLLLNNNNYSSLCSYSSPTSSSPSFFLANDHEVPSYGISQGEGFSLEVDTNESSATTKVNEGGSHAAMDDEDMEEMRSLGEQYQMEWNDTMNLVTSILWFNFLKKMEHDDAPQEGACHHVFDEFMDFPTWLNAHEEHEERCLEEWSEDYFLDPNLPW